MPIRFLDCTVGRSNSRRKRTFKFKYKRFCLIFGASETPKRVFKILILRWSEIDTDWIISTMNVGKRIAYSSHHHPIIRQPSVLLHYLSRVTNTQCEYSTTSCTHRCSFGGDGLLQVVKALIERNFHMLETLTQFFYGPIPASFRLIFYLFKRILFTEGTEPSLQRDSNSDFWVEGKLTYSLAAATTTDALIIRP